MIECREHLGLAVEPSDALGIGGHRFWKHLDGNVAVELRVRRPIDHTHATGTDLVSDLVRAKAGAGSYSHRQSPDLAVHSEVIAAIISPKVSSGSILPGSGQRDRPKTQMKSSRLDLAGQENRMSAFLPESSRKKRTFRLGRDVCFRPQADVA